MMISRMLLSSSNIIAIPRPGWLTDFFNARFRSLDIQLDRVEEVLSHYGLDVISSPKNLPNTRRNRNLMVQTSDGLKILKLYRDDWKTSTITFEHSILTKLAALDFPAPRLLKMQDGRTWLPIGAHIYCMFDFIEGNNHSSKFLVRQQRVRMMATSGRLMARVHRTLAGFLPEGEHHLGFQDYSGERHRHMAWHENKVKKLTASSKKLIKAEDSMHANRLIDDAGHLLDDLNQLDETLNQASLPRTIIHGDYGLHNLIYQNLDEAVPVDYELARLDWRLSDLVSAVSKFRYKDGSYDSESITQFIHAYQMEYPIDADEWRYFPLVWKFHKLMKAVQYWSSYFETNGPVRKLRSSRDELAQSTWVLENPEWLAAIRTGG